MAVLLAVETLHVTDIPNGRHVEVGFKYDGKTSLGVLVKFDVIAPCKDRAFWFFQKDCAPVVSVINKKLLSWQISGSTLPPAPEYIIEFALLDPVDIQPDEAHCAHVKITLQGFYHPAAIPVVVAHGSASTVVGGGSAQGGTNPCLSEDLVFRFCCEDCTFKCLVVPPEVIAAS
jgi:hypothetical protein